MIQSNRTATHFDFLHFIFGNANLFFHRSSQFRVEANNLISAKLLDFDVVLLHQLISGLLLTLDSINALLCSCSILSAAHLVQVDFIRAISDSKCAEMSPHICQWRILADSHGSVSLDGAIYDRQSHVRGDHFALCDFKQC